MQLVEKVLQDRYLKHNNPVNHPLPKITTTGHSLGAALATLCAFHIAHELPSGSTTMHEGYRKQLQTPGAVVAYAFASPRVGNKAFADAVKATPGMRVLRLSNLCDLVPRTPLPLGGRQGWLGEPHYSYCLKAGMAEHVISAAIGLPMLHSNCVAQQLCCTMAASGG